MFKVLRTNRDIRLLFIGDNISIVGDYFTYIALAGLIKDYTGSNFLVALVYVAFTIPSFFVSPIAGPIISHIPDSAILRFRRCAVFAGKGLIEPEVAFVMARDLPPRALPYSDDEIRAAIGEARFVLELLATRYADKGSATPMEILADAFNNHGLVIGPVVPNIFSYNLDKLHAKISTPSATLFDEERNHPSGNPMNSIRWLVHFLNSRGQGLQAGQIVTTGSYAGIVDAPLNTPVHAELGGFGALDVELITASR